MDERDAGPLYFTLLLGLSLPIWLSAAMPCSAAAAAGATLPSPAGPPRPAGSWVAAAEQPAAHGGGAACTGPLPAVLAGLSGLMVIGFGDTMASVVGRTYGRVPIHDGSRKTVEGTLAGALSTMAAWWVLLLAARSGSARAPTWAVAPWPSVPQWQHLAAATVGACLLEACTSQLDNILIPLWYFPHCLLVGPSAVP